ncbi:spindle pole body formation-associated protein-domain-containing protein [Xylaria cf. heliscus]|nr:spindle pole body formation-associated protein-domain-containing protein [Xylaria cf. heliscus]
MLGWALKKGLQGATGLRDAPEGGGDTTQIDAPDTPAPVFAARAIRNAIWGQPATTNGQPATTNGQPAVTKTKKTERVEPAPKATTSATTSATAVPTDTRSPTKLNSILLTPGTGTSRRKRVSFGRDVKAGNNVDASPSSARSSRLRRKTTLQQALENSRPGKPQVEESEEDDTEDDGEWEDEDICCNHELTVDLNEPHSESGKYWKAEWSRYREEAKSDIEQLVKYKANAKSYAAKKDMEASRLSQKLKEEQSKVTSMEAKIAEMTAKLSVTGRHGTDKDNAAMAKDLARQTSLVAEYRERMKDLETRLKEASSGSSLNHRINTSPRTEQNIIEVSRELRKARTELRQLDRLREEVKRLKSTLATARERVAELEARAAAGETSESSRIEKLERQLREVKEESRQKDADIRKLKRDYESLKRDAKSRTTEALQVLQDKNAKIDQLEKKVKDMEAANASKRSKSLDAAIAEHSRITRDLKSDIESLSKPSRYAKARPISRHTRAASVEDMTLDMTQRSLLREKDDHITDDIRRTNAHGAGLITDWTADIPTFELQMEDKDGWEDAKKLDTKTTMEGMGALSSRRAAKSVEQRSLDVKHRVTSDVLSHRINESTRRRLRRNQLLETNDGFAADRNQLDNGGRISSARTTSLAEDRATIQGAMDQSPRRSRPLSRITRPASPVSEAPVIDLVQDRFSRLGGPSADRSALGNTSRCALPAGRQAAARARLEQKKLERRKTSGQGLEKENVRP